MKPKIFSLTIAIILSSLIAYTVYAYSVESKKTISTVFAFISFFSYLGGLIGVKADYEKAQTLKSTVSVIFIFINILSTFVFLRADYAIPLYLLINGFILLTYYGLVNFFVKAKF